MATVACPCCGGAIRLTWEPPRLVIRVSEHQCGPHGGGEPLPKAA